MNEHSFIRSMHRQLPTELYKWKINDNFQGGVADAYYSGSGGDLWVEYKYLAKLPKRPTTIVKIELTGQQKLWLRSRRKEGRNIAVIIGSPQGHVILYDQLWEKEITAEEFIKKCLTTKQIADTIVKETIKQ